MQSDEAVLNTTQAPMQRWLVLTEFGVELQPTGNRGLAGQFLKAVKPYRRRATLVTAEAYRRAHVGGRSE